MLNVIKKHAASILVLSMVFVLVSVVISCDSAGSETPNATPNATIGNVKAATTENVGVVQVSWEVSEGEQFVGYHIELKDESETIIHYTLHETGKSEYSMEIQVPAGTYSTTVTGVQGGDDASRNTLSTTKGSAGSTVEIQTEGTPVPVLTVSGQVTGTVAAPEVIATVGWSIPENSEITKGTLYWAVGSSVSVWKYAGSKDITADLATASTDISGLEVDTEYTFIALWESSAGIRSVSTIETLGATPNDTIGNVKAATTEDAGVVQVSWEVREGEQFAGYHIELKSESETIIHYTLHETGKSEYSMEIQVPAGTYSTTVTGVLGGDDASRNTLSTTKGSAGSTVEIQTEGTPVPVLTVSGQVTGTVAATEVIATVGWSIPENSEITKGTLYWAAGSSVSVWKYAGSKDITADLERASTDISGLEVDTEYTFIALWESSAGIRSVSTIETLEAKSVQAEAPAVLAITVTADSTTEGAILTVSWELEGYNAGKTVAGEAADIQKILVYWKQGSDAIDTGENTADTHQEVGASDTGYAIKSLDLESSYSVVVKVVNIAELSSISEQTTVETPKVSRKTEPGVVTDLSAAADTSSTQVTVSWVAPESFGLTDDGEPATLVNYHIYYGETGTPISTGGAAKYTTTETSKIIPAGTLSGATDYTIVVVVESSTGLKSADAEKTVTTTDVSTAPGVIDTDTVTVDLTEIRTLKLTWQAVANGTDKSGNAVHSIYEIYYQESAVGSIASSVITDGTFHDDVTDEGKNTGDELSTTLSGLTSGTNYDIVIRAINSEVHEKSTEILKTGAGPVSGVTKIEIQLGGTPVGETLAKTSADDPFTLKAVVTAHGVADTSVSWASTDEAVATIDSSSGEVSLTGAGTSTLTATSTVDSMASSASVELTVTPSVASYSFSYGALTKQSDETVSVSPAWSASAITATYSTTDTLPDGLTLNPTDGTISGTYTATGGHTTKYTITATGTEKYEGETTAVFFDTFVLESYTKVETGTAISTREELEKIGKDESFPLAGNYYLTASIDLSGANWEPLGSWSSPFTGTLHGNGHVIYNLKIAGVSEDSDNGNYQGLFARIDGSTAKVENLGIGVSSIKGNVAIGAVAGIVTSATVTNIAAVAMSAPSADAPTLEASGKETITIGGTSGSYVGGLVGRSSGTVSGYATGAVTGADDYVGGLVGFVLSGTVSGYARGAVRGGDAVGGLVGRIDDGTVNGYATGAVTGGNNIGGLVGYVLSGTVSGYAPGAVTGSRDAVGGLVGRIDGGTLSGYATGAVTGNGSIGGLVGHVGSSGTVSGYATGAVSGVGAHVGGLGGSNHGTLSGYATGAVKGAYQVGGLAGSNTGTSGTLSGYATGAVTGTGNYVGGLVGSNEGALSGYATGAVKGSGQNVGGLMALNFPGGTVSGYWDKASTEQSGSARGVGISATANIVYDTTDSKYKDSKGDPDATQHVVIFDNAEFLKYFDLPGKAQTWPKLKVFDWSGFDYIEWKQPTVSDANGDGKIEVIVN